MLGALLKGMHDVIWIERICFVESRKRGLPHAHILTSLAEEDKLSRPIANDNLVSAGLLDA